MCNSRRYNLDHFQPRAFLDGGKNEEVLIEYRNQACVQTPFVMNNCFKLTNKVTG